MAIPYNQMSEQRTPSTDKEEETDKVSVSSEYMRKIIVSLWDFVGTGDGVVGHTGGHRFQIRLLRGTD